MAPPRGTASPKRSKGSSHNKEEKQLYGLQQQLLRQQIQQQQLMQQQQQLMQQQLLNQQETDMRHQKERDSQLMQPSDNVHAVSPVQHEGAHLENIPSAVDNQVSVPTTHHSRC